MEMDYDKCIRILSLLFNSFISAVWGNVETIRGKYDGNEKTEDNKEEWSIMPMRHLIV